MLSPAQQKLKRTFDVLLALLVLPFTLLLFIPLFLLATLSSGRSGVFTQYRIGKEGSPFRLYKLRSLKGTDHRDIHEIMAHETPFGRWLRQTKLDELPQVLNVLMGDMSWVGPRPDVPGYADKLEGSDRMILNLRPGITGPATLKYRNEDALLVAKEDPAHFNDTVIWPDKVAINKQYMNNWSLQKDIGYLWKSVFN